MKLLKGVILAGVAVAVFAGCAAVLEPYKSASPFFHVCSIKREDKLLAIDGQSKLVSSKGINSQSSRNTGKFSGLGGIDKWHYEARFLPTAMQGEEYVVVFDAKSPDKVFDEPVTVKFEYMYPKGVEVHYSEKTYENLPRGRHKYVWKNLGSQNVKNGDIVGWRASLHCRGEEVASMHSALWRPWGKVVMDE